MNNLLKRIIIFAILVTSIRLYSQNYYPFPDSNAIWNTVGENIYSSNEFRIRYGIFGDTTINSRIYHKIYNLYDTNLIHQNSTYFAAMRNDDKKVIINIPGYPETVLYDFSLSVGDTIWYEIGGEAMHNGIYLYLQSHWKTVVSIDSIILENGEYRKRWHLNANINMSDTWVEGVGSVDWFGLFNPIITDAITNGDNYYFACFKKNNQVVYLNNPLCDYCFCQLYTNIEEQNSEKKEIITFYPNPTKNKINIRINESGKSKYKIEIYNLIGDQYIEKTINLEKDIEIELDNFKRGMYLIKVLNLDNKIVRTKKLIIE